MYSSLRFFLSLTNDSFFFIQNRPKCYSVFITQQQLNENIAVTFQPFCGNKKHRRWEEKNKSIIKKILSVGSPVFGQGTRNLRLCRFIFSCVPAWGLKSSCQSILLMMFKEYISATAEFLIIRQVSMAENAGIFPRENELPVCSSVLTLSSPPRTRESYRVPQAVTELLTGLGPAGAGSCNASGRRWPGHAPGRVRHQDPVSSWSWSWAQSRTGTQQTHSPLDFRFPAWKGHLLCDTLDLLLLRTAILINLSSSFVKPGCIPMPCFCTSSPLSSAAPKFPALAGLKAAPAHFPVSQPSASFWLPLSAVVWEQPQSPASLYLAV